MTINTHFPDDAPRLFCLSMQRTGTTSVGKFYRDFGFQWAGAPADVSNNWYLSWYEGDFEAIFASEDFRRSNAFEDSPWFLPDFYRVLYHRFPGARFILLTRDADSWFESLVALLNAVRADGLWATLPNANMTHSKLYRRELEYFDLLHSGATRDEIEERLVSEESLRRAVGHYKDVYRRHNTEVQDYFQRNAPDALFVAQLEDQDKWQKLGRFLGITVPEGYESFENRMRS